MFQLFGCSNFHLQKFSIFSDWQFFKDWEVSNFLIFIILTYLSLYIVFGTYEIISVLNFLNLKNNNFENDKIKYFRKWKVSFN